MMKIYLSYIVFNCEIPGFRCMIPSGCTLFADKSETGVAIMYLELFRDLSMVGSYAWGAVCMAYLYRKLTTATRFEVRQLGGYLTLLQVRLMTIFDNF